MNLIGCFLYEQEGHLIRDCPQLVAVETSEVGTVASTPGTIDDILVYSGSLEEHTEHLNSIVDSSRASVIH